MFGNLYGKQPVYTTAEKLERLKKEVGHIKIKHFEEIITKKINDLGFLHLFSFKTPINWRFKREK
jgi:hypothetical protein